MPTYALRPIERLREDWEAQSRSRTSRVALERLSDAEPVIAATGAQDLGDLVASLLGAMGGRRLHGGRPSAGGGPEHSARIIQAMLRSGHLHALIPRALVQALMPGFVGVARRLTWGTGGDWGDAGSFFVELISTAWEVIDEWSGQDRAYAVLDVLSAVRCRLRRRILRHRAASAVELSYSDGDLGTCGEDPAQAASPLDELALAIERERGRTIGSRDAAVLYAHRVLGYSLAELSRSTGRSRRYLAECRDFATGALTA